MADEATATDTGAAGTEQQAADSLLTGQAAEPTSEDTGAQVEAGTEGDAEGNPGEEAGDKGQDELPETYADFELPEGMQLDATTLESATPMFKELGLTQDQAQKVVSFYADQVKAGEQKQIDAFNQLTDDWRSQSMNDKEFGGDHFEESVGIARQALDKFGTPELKTLLSEHGVGNHPEVIRMMIKVGKLTQEDVPGADGQVSNPEQSRVDILYPKKATG